MGLPLPTASRILSSTRFQHPASASAASAGACYPALARFTTKRTSQIPLLHGDKIVMLMQIL